MFNSFSLETERLKLVPLEIYHLAEYEKVFSANLFKHTRSQYLTAAEFLEDKIKLYRLGMAVPFTIISKLDNCVIGFTSFISISIKDKYLEMSGTWIGQKYQKKGYNSEIKISLFAYIFGVLNFSRVNIMTESNNKPAISTLDSLGIRRVGIVKNFLIISGENKDGVLYAITSEEWENIRSSYPKNIYMPKTNLETSYI